MGQVTEITSLEQWKELLKGGPACVAFFWADWHEPSKRGGQMDTVVQHLAGLHPHALFVKVEAEAVPEVSMLFDISVVPTCIFLRGGPEAVVDKLEGAHPSELAKKVQALGLPTPPSVGARTGGTSSTSVAAEKPSDLNARIRQLISSAPVVLVMKGAPSEPKCGFSSKLVALLKEEGIDFASFDVLKDEQVRQGIKAYSNWPTFPQLYCNGELVGGLDIVTEMKQAGPLKEQLQLHATPAPANGSAAEGSTAPPDPKAALEQRLRRLINRAPVMLFMKGSPDAPRCGFSSQIVELLKGEGIAFESFDILQDEDVRQGLKVLSDWATYPQLYAKGELVGGLDIVKEMKGQGPLAAQLGVAAQEPLDDRLRKLVRQSPVMLFMKGSPEEPKCGFSSKIVSMLKEEGFSFGHFDILTDEEVRQGLKAFADWKTYPMLFVDGELVGGLDIVTELRGNGELAALKR